MNADEQSEPDQALRSQLESLTPQLLAWAHLRLPGRPTADAEDLTQEVLCRAIVKLSTFRGGNLAAFVFTIGKHVLLEHHRRKRRSGRIRTPEGDSAADAAMDGVAAEMTTLTRKVARSETLQSLLQLVGDLDEADRKLALLCGMEGMTCRDAGVQLGVSEEATTKRWQRLRERLRHAAPWLAP